MLQIPRNCLPPAVHTVGTRLELLSCFKFFLTKWRKSLQVQEYHLRPPSSLTPPKYLNCYILIMYFPVTNICDVWTGVRSWKDYLQVSLNKSNTLHAVYLRIYWSGPRKETVLLMVLTLCLMWALILFPWNVYLRFETISLRSVSRICQLQSFVTCYENSQKNSGLFSRTLPKLTDMLLSRCTSYLRKQGQLWQFLSSCFQIFLRAFRYWHLSHYMLHAQEASWQHT